MSFSAVRDDIHHLLARGDFAAAERVLTARLRSDPDDAQSLFLLGRVAGERGDREREMEMTRRAVELVPGSSEYRAQLARCHALRSEADLALAQARQAAADPDATDQTLDMIADVYARLHQHSDALAVLERAANEGTGNPAVLFNLSTARKFCGDFDGAIAALESALAVSPNYIKARVALSAIRVATPERNQIHVLHSLADRAVDPVVLLQLCQAAARECDTLGRYDEAFAFLKRGKAAMLSATKYDFAQDQALFQSIRTAFEAESTVPASLGFDGAAPIFVVGMPRSGTTVVDRILSGHPDVTSIGESLQFPWLLQRLSQHRSAQLIDPAAASGLATHADMATLGRAYIDGLPPIGDAERPLDKFHLNSLLSGYIARALPRARIVCIHRGGLDTVVGNYRQAFEHGTHLYRYSLTLDSIARYYVEFRRLADFWADRFPENFLQISYEALIADPVTTARRVFEFCGLTWDERYLKIEENAAPVATASAVQVRQALNARSVGQWRRYERHLEESRKILKAAGLDS